MIEIPVTFSTWISQYGSFALFCFLALGIVALPIPEDSLLIFSGILIAQGKLPLFPTIIAAYAGGVCGITLSYIIGRTAGLFLLKKYGKWIGISHAKLEKIHRWFERAGKWTLVIGYFIAGVRHLTGYAAGMTELHYKKFALFAYCGALVWVLTFITIGYYVGNSWDRILQVLEEQWDIATFVGLILVASYLGWKVHKRRKHKKQSHSHQAKHHH